MCSSGLRCTVPTSLTPLVKSFSRSALSGATRNALFLSQEEDSDAKEADGEPANVDPHLLSMNTLQ